MTEVTQTVTTVDSGLPWDQRFERIIRENVPFLTDEEPLLPDTSLSDFGLTSQELLGLMVAVEGEYAFTLPDRLLVFETFATPGALWEAIVSLRAAQPDAAADPSGDELPDVGAVGGADIPPGYELPEDAEQRAVVSFALAQLGKPYVYGAVGPASYDCSALMMKAWAEAGVTIPRTAAEQARTGVNVSSLDTMQPGDLIVMPGSDGTMSRPRHVGMYIGRDDAGRQWLVQAPQTGDVVKTIPVANVVGQIAALRRPCAQ